MYRNICIYCVVDKIATQLIKYERPTNDELLKSSQKVVLKHNLNVPKTILFASSNDIWQ